MDSLANYGSEDETEECTNEKTGTKSSTSMAVKRSDDVNGRKHNQQQPEMDVNYEQIQMELSEESPSRNNSPSDEPERNHSRNLKRNRSRSRSRDRDRSHRTKSSASKYDRSPEDRKRSDRKYKEERNRNRKHGHRSGSRDRDRERNRSKSKEKERQRSRSRERRRSRSPRRDYRRRSHSRDRDRDTGGGNSRFGKRYDRASSKMAQLEKLGIAIKTPDSEFVTPQMLLQRTMDEQVQKVKDSTGIEFPKYYNPIAMNPARYAEQIQKRRLLWQKKPETVCSAAAAAPAVVEPETSKQHMGKVWEQTTFAQDSDGKVASKFKRLMGIKEEVASGSKDATGKDSILKKQEEMFSSMEQQYEVARTATHTMRGVGLGFGSYTNYPR